MNSYTHYPSSGALGRTAATEAPTSDSRQPKSAGLTALLKRIGQSAVSFLTQGNELRIWTRQRHGHLVWHVYDPMTEQRQQFSSEADLRDWLENRYYE